MLKKIMLLLFPFFVLNLQGQTLKLAGDSWAPFTDQEGANPGFMVELAGKVLEKEGIQWTYKLTPWTRAIEDTKKGTVDILVAIPDDQALAEGLIVCPEPFGYNTNDFFVNVSSKWTYNQIKSLDTETLGVIQDYSYTAEIDQYIEKYKNDSKRIQISTGDNPMAMSLKKLTGNRLTVIIDDKSVIMWQAKQLGLLDKIKLAGTSGSPVPSFLAISPKNPKAKEISEKLAAGLKKMKGTPEFKTILQKYGVTPWK